MLNCNAAALQNFGVLLLSSIFCRLFWEANKIVTVDITIFR